MPKALGRTLAVIAAAMVILSIVTPGLERAEITAWMALAALALLVAANPATEESDLSQDTPSTVTGSAPLARPERRGPRARAAILGHLSDGPDEGFVMIASFIDKNLPPSTAGSARDLAHAHIAQRVRELTDRRAIELAEQLGLTFARRKRWAIHAD